MYVLLPEEYSCIGKCEDVFVDLICEMGWLRDLNKVVDNLPEIR